MIVKPRQTAIPNTEMTVSMHCTTIIAVSMFIVTETGVPSGGTPSM